MKYCPYCSKKVNEDQDVCLSCGKTIKNTNNGKSRILAAILALLVGSLGVHNFYLGYNSKGVIQLVLTIIGYIFTLILIGYVLIAIVNCWAFIEAIMLFIGSIKVDGEGKELI